MDPPKSGHDQLSQREHRPAEETPFAFELASGFLERLKLEKRPPRFFFSVPALPPDAVLLRLGAFALSALQRFDSSDEVLFMAFVFVEAARLSPVGESPSEITDRGSTSSRTLGPNMSSRRRSIPARSIRSCASSEERLEDIGWT